MRNFEVKSVYSGFELISKEYNEDYSSTGYLFRHIKTGFEVYFLSNEDEECFFSYSVFTPPEDNTGVFHILEHTVLAGSEKYRVKDPFMEINKYSPNTYLNAMTSLDRTDFSASSPLKKDFDNIFLVYSDAVFAPLLRKESFLQEGIRFSKKGGLHPEGVVYNEMKGDENSKLSLVTNLSLRYLYDPSSPCMAESGGKSSEIINLTYEKFIETYKKYYVPNNMRLFLYGKIDVEEKLTFLNDEYLSSRVLVNKIPLYPVQKRWDKGREVGAYSLDDGDSESTISLSWLLGGAEDEKSGVIFSLLSDILLSSPASPLYKDIISSGLGKDISECSGLSDEGRNLSFVVGISGTKEEKKEEVKNCILNSLKKIVKNGIDKILLFGTLKRALFREEEEQDGIPRGYKLYFNKIEKGWIYGKNPSTMLLGKSFIKEIKDQCVKDDRFFESYIQRDLLDNPHMLISIVTNKKEEEKNRNEKLKENLKKIEYKREDEKLYKKWLRKNDEKEDLLSLPSLSISDIPDKILHLTRWQEGNIIFLEENSKEIAYVTIFFDVSDYSTEEMQYLSFLSRLLSMTNVRDISYDKFLGKIRYFTGQFEVRLECSTNIDGVDKEYFKISFSALKEDLDNIFDLIKDLLKDGDVKTEERINAVINDLYSTYSSILIEQAHVYAFSYSSRMINRSSFIQEMCSGLSFIDFIVRINLLDREEVAETLLRLKNKTFIKERCTIHIAGSKELLKKEEMKSKELISFLPNGDYDKNKKEIFNKTKVQDCLFSFPSEVGFSSLSFKSSDMKTKEGVEEEMFLSLLSDGELWKILREKNGAYGGGSGFTQLESIGYFFSYRDPCLNSIKNVYKSALQRQKVDVDLLKRGKLNVLGFDIVPRGIKSKNRISSRRFVTGFDENTLRKRKDLQLSIDIKGLKNAKERILSYMKEGVLTVIGKNGKCSEVKSLPILS